MQILRSLAELGTVSQPSIVTIGNFDGVHCGHQTVIAAVIARARALNARSVVVTFDPHPARVLQKGPQTPLITPLSRKLELLAATGIDLALVLPFDDALRTLTARQFCERVLCTALQTLEIHEGETFRFGHKAEGDVNSLSQLGEELCFKVRAFEPVEKRGSPVSSSRIRALIQAGDVRHARALLGRPFSIDSTPASGRGYGTRYAVPTINLAPYPELVPGNGVYITALRVGDGPKARTFRGVTNAGNRPTFGADSYAIETHLFGFEPVDLSSETPLRMTFLERLRGEQRFDSPEALRAQIGRDVANAQRYFRLCDRLGIRL